MIRSNLSHPEPSSPGETAHIDQAVFSQIYDQYAPVLLGIIGATVHDEVEAVRVLESTFGEVRSQFEQFRPESQPLFVWLLSIARRRALEAQKSQTETIAPVLQTSNLRKATSTMSRADSTTLLAVAPPENELLHAVLFKGCTLDQAASSVGLPVETAQQQLRWAVQQLRALRVV